MLRIKLQKLNGSTRIVLVDRNGRSTAVSTKNPKRLEQELRRLAA